jgi:RecB family exonuclease
MSKRVRKIRKSKKNERPDYLSFSQLNTFINCPRKYKFHYIDKIPVIGFVPAIFLGSKSHKYIEVVLTSRLKIKDLSKKERNSLRKEMSAEMREEMSESIRKVHVEIEKQAGGLVNFDPSINKDVLIDQFEQLTEQWDIDILPEIKPVGVEKKIETEIGGVNFLMYIDLIRQTESGLQVIDWKVTKRAKGRKAAETSLQLSIYAAACGVHSVGFGSLIRAQEGKEAKWTPRVQLDTANRQPGDHEWTHKVVGDIAKAIDKSTFPVCAPDNFLCTENFCEYWSICRGQHVKEVKDPSWFNK